MEKQLRRIWFHYNRLQNALNAAHNDGLIKYDDSKYAELAPCQTLWETRGRIEATTKNQIADLVQREIRSKV